MGLFDIFRKKKTDEKNEATQDNLEQADEQQNVQEQAPITDDSDVSEVTDGTDIVSTTSEEETVDDTVVSDDTATSDENITNETIVADETIVTTAPTIDTDDADVSEVADKADIVSTTSDDEAHTSTDEQAIYNKGLTKSRGGFAERFNRFLANFRTVDEDFFDDLEETLIGSDVGFDMVIRISDELREEVKLKNAKRKEDVSDVIIKKLVDIYEEEGSGEDNQMHFAPTGQPTIIMFVGVNGVGKTTTIGKLASQYQKAGKRVLLAAADTFRAGATKQLQEWGAIAQVPVVAGKDKSDPASVVFEAVKKARDEAYDVLFIDTAGRLQNNFNLMQELEKMKRVVQREIPDAPHEVLLVLDATTGQNAIQQAKLFKDSTDVTGIVLTKMDGTAKGGIVFAIRSEMHLPVKWIGFGEKATDLRVFKPEEFVYGLFKDLVES